MKAVYAMNTIGRRSVLAGTVGAFGIGRARAAEPFRYKFAHNVPVTHPLHVRATQAAELIKAETNGALDIQVFPNNQLGSDTDVLSQLRSGAVEFFTLSGLILSTLVPVASISGIGFAFNDYDGVWRAMDGDLGGLIRAEIQKVGIQPMARIWDNGFRHMTSQPKPIRTPADLDGFKMRVPVSPLWTSMFRAFGSSPISINAAEMYSALQTRIADGQENPLAAIWNTKLYEVQRYAALTGHMWDGYWCLANRRAWTALPEDVRAVAARHLDQAALDQRADLATLNTSTRADLEGKGMAFNDVDKATFRARLESAGFYKEWRGKYGEANWAVLQRASGQLPAGLTRSSAGMSGTLTLVGNAADFMDAATNQGPDWEHLALLREPGAEAVAIDGLRTAPGAFMPGRGLVDAGLLYRLGRALRGRGPVLAQSEQSGYLAALALAPRFRGTPLYTIFHGHRWWTRRNRALAAVVKRLPWVQVLCLSSSLRELVIGEYGIPPGRVHTTGYGVDGRYFAPAPLEGAGCIVSAGAASRDYKTLAEAGAGLAVQIKIAADSTWYREALNLGEADVPGNVEIFSSGSYAGLRSLYASARFVVVPLLDVRFACGYAVIAEAMAMGKAVIATRNGCPSDLIEDGVTGLYVPPGDAAALRAAMQLLLDDPERSAEMGRAARRRIEQNFTLDAYVARLRGAMGLG